jgi:putative spermidine/putrescine transport system permease protein
MAEIALPRPVAMPGLGRQAKLFLLLAPTLLLTLFFFVIPMTAVLLNSFTIGDGEAARYSLENYASIVTDGFYWEVMWRTLRISVLTTAVALLISYPACLYIYFSESGWRRVFLLVVVSPLFISVIVRTYGWMVVLSPNGLLDLLLPEPFELHLLHTQTAIVIALAHIYVPFMVLALNASFQKIDRRLLSAASSLGASGWRGFRDVLLPLSLPGIHAGCILVFANAMTAFATPTLLGGSSNKTMAYMIYQQNLLLANWQMGGAVAFVLLATTLAAVLVFGRLTERRDLKGALQ